MKLKQIKVNGFRLLNDFSVDLQEDLSLIIGKNNTGKTSLLTVLDRFLNGNKSDWKLDDFNFKVRSQLLDMFLQEMISEEKFQMPKIQLRLYLEYLPSDSSKNYSYLIMNLDKDNYEHVLSFEYSLDYQNYQKLYQDWNSHAPKLQAANKKNALEKYLSKKLSQYTSIVKKVLDPLDETQFQQVDDNIIKKIISIQFISAKRDVANDDSTRHSIKTLSKLSLQYCESLPKQIGLESLPLESQLQQTDDKLTEQYESLFKPVYENFQKFISNGMNIKVVSNLQSTNLLRENTSVEYHHGEHILPEEYNGLGYLNLFSIIFNIHIQLDKFKRIHNTSDESPADINILFIEEPEAHTHPQMQYNFINNIKQMLKGAILDEDGKQQFNLQTILTTHSAHIVSQSDFNDIKYFVRTDQNNVIAKNLSDLKKEYSPSEKQSDDNEEIQKQFKFLKQYLTLHNSELFFADKVIFVEGDTERILLPAMMKKYDKEHKTDLLAQNISIISVGNYVHVFEKFLNFLQIYALVITDIDSIDKNRTTCRVKEGKSTSNPSINHFLRDITYNELLNLDATKKQINDHIRITYQTKEEDYHARSFEDAFIHINREFINKNKETFYSLKCANKIADRNIDAFQIAKDCIQKKSVFATDILFHSTSDFSEWKIPQYIMEGLTWLASLKLNQ